MKTVNTLLLMISFSACTEFNKLYFFTYITILFLGIVKILKQYSIPSQIIFSFKMRGFCLQTGTKRKAWHEEAQCFLQLSCLHACPRTTVQVVKPPTLYSVAQNMEKDASKDPHICGTVMINLEVNRENVKCFINGPDLMHGRH